MRSNPGLHGHIWLFDRERVELTVPEPARRRPLRMPKPGDRYSGTAEEFLAVQVFDSLEHGETGGSYRLGFQLVPKENESRYIVGNSLFRACPGFPLGKLTTPNTSPSASSSFPTVFSACASIATTPPCWAIG